MYSWIEVITNRDDRFLHAETLYPENTILLPICLLMP